MPPTFEIHRPDLIDPLGSLATAQSPRFAGPALFTPVGKTSGFQYPFKTALTGYLSVLTQIQFPNLTWAPMGMDHLQPHDLTELFLAQLLGTTSRAVGTLRLDLPLLVAGSVPAICSRFWY